MVHAVPLPRSWTRAMLAPTGGHGAERYVRFVAQQGRDLVGRDAHGAGGGLALDAEGTRQRVGVALPKLHPSLDAQGLHHAAAVERPVPRGRGLAGRDRVHHGGQALGLADHAAHRGRTHVQTRGHGVGGSHGGGVAAVGGGLGARSLGGGGRVGRQQRHKQGKGKKMGCQSAAFKGPRAVQDRNKNVGPAALPVRQRRPNSQFESGESMAV